MQMPTINSQNCFWVAYLFIHSFLCWWQRGKASAIEDVFNMSHTMSAWGSSQLPPPQVQQPSYRARTLSLHCRKGWHLGCEECRGGWDMVLYQWDNESLALWRSLLDHQRSSGRSPPGWSHTEDTTELYPTRPHHTDPTGGWTLDSYSSQQVGKWMSLFQGFLSFSELFPVGLQLAFPVVTGQRPAICGTHLSLPWVWWTSHFSYLYNFPSPGWTSVNHSRPNEQTGRWQQLQSELPTKTNRTSSHLKSHTQVSHGLQ